MKFPLREAFAAFGAKHLPCADGRSFVSGFTLEPGEPWAFLVVLFRCPGCGLAGCARMKAADAELEVEAMTGLPFIESIQLLERNPDEWRCRFAAGWALPEHLDRLVRQDSEQAN